MSVPENDALAKLRDAATTGPWTVRTLENFGFNVVHYRDGDKFDILRVAKCSHDANADLVSLAPDLAAEVIALRERVKAADAMAELLDQVQRQGCEICNGDCASANPPVTECPPSTRAAALAAYRAPQAPS